MIATQQSASVRPEVEAVKRGWARGGGPDALEALARHPEWRAEKSIVLELALEEYYQRHENGERPDIDAFCDRFPSHRMALRPLLEAHGVMAADIGLLEAVTVRWPEPGERLGDLTLVRELGRGAFARVYLATEESTGGRPVAVKFSPQGAGEARTMGRLTHPGVVPVYWARLEAEVGLTAVCMPFLGAATLTDLLDRAYPTPVARPPLTARVVADAVRTASRPGDPAPLPSAPAPAGGAYTEAVARLGLQIAEALAFLHARGVVHRDLKPSNVLLGPGGRALLLDFNLSADARAGEAVLGGTMPYAAPEQLRAMTGAGGAAQCDGRGDVFALGVILYELLTGRKPFGDLPPNRPPRVAAETILKRQAEGCPPLRSLNPGVDRRLAGLVGDCLAFDPARRPASAAAVASRLRDYLSRPARLRRWAARRPWAIAAAALALVGAAWSVAAFRPPAAAHAAAAESADAHAYRVGREAYLKGDYRAAREAFARALDAAPDGEKYLKAKAEAELRLGEAGDDAALSAARDDLGVLTTHGADGGTMAQLGYYYSRRGQHADAQGWYARAEAAGCVSAALFNDRAYSAMARRQWEPAAADLGKALALDPNLLAAHYNRAMLTLRPRPLGAPPPIPDDVLQGMRRAAGQAPGCLQIHLDAARLFAAAAAERNPPDPAMAREALGCLARACVLGADPKELEKNRLFQSVLGPLDAFHTLQQGAERPTISDIDLRLIDPVPYRPD